jgi:hypothetical protein
VSATTPSSDTTSPALLRMCHHRKMMHRFVVSQVKSI